MVAACLLHNFCLIEHDDWAEMFHEVQDAGQHHHQVIDPDYAAREKVAGQLKRDRIRNSFIG